MASQQPQGDLDILQEIKNKIQKFTQQNQTHTREIFHLIEGLTVEVNSLRRQVNLSTSKIQTPGVNMEHRCTERGRPMNYPQAAYVNEEFHVQEVSSTIEGIVSYSIAFCTIFWILGVIVYKDISI